VLLLFFKSFAAQVSRLRGSKNLTLARRSIVLLATIMGRRYHVFTSLQVLSHIPRR
jgi:hypothetical protein